MYPHPKRSEYEIQQNNLLLLSSTDINSIYFHLLQMKKLNHTSYPIIIFKRKFYGNINYETRIYTMQQIIEKVSNLKNTNDTTSNQDTEIKSQIEEEYNESECPYLNKNPECNSESEESELQNKIELKKRKTPEENILSNEPTEMLMRALNANKKNIDESVDYKDIDLSSNQDDQSDDEEHKNKFYEKINKYAKNINQEHKINNFIAYFRSQINNNSNETKHLRIDELTDENLNFIERLVYLNKDRKII